MPRHILGYNPTSAKPAEVPGLAAGPVDDAVRVLDGQCPTFTWAPRRTA